MTVLPTVSDKAMQGTSSGSGQASTHRRGTRGGYRPLAKCSAGSPSADRANRNLVHVLDNRDALVGSVEALELASAMLTKPGSHICRSSKLLGKMDIPLYLASSAQPYVLSPPLDPGD